MVIQQRMGTHSGFSSRLHTLGVSTNLENVELLGNFKASGKVGELSGKITDVGGAVTLNEAGT